MYLTVRMRARIFAKDGDYAAFERVLCETLERKPMRILGYLAMPNHWHMVLWPEHDGELAAFMQRLTTTHVRRWHLHRKTVGCGHLYQGTYKSFPIEADEHLLTVSGLRRAKCLACGIGRACGGLAMVEPVALAASRGDGGCAAVDELAGRSAAAMVVPGESTRSENRVGIAANGRATRSSLWKRGLAGDDCPEARARIDLSPSRTPEETQIMGLIPFCLPAAPGKDDKNHNHHRLPQEFRGVFLSRGFFDGRVGANPLVHSPRAGISPSLTGFIRL